MFTDGCGWGLGPYLLRGLSIRTSLEHISRNDTLNMPSVTNSGHNPLVDVMSSTARVIEPGLRHISDCSVTHSVRKQ